MTILKKKKAEHWRTDAYEMWCWRRLLTVPWTARGSNQSILKEISPEYSLGRLMLKLKLQYFGHLMWRADSFEKTLMLGKIEGGRRRGRQRMRWLPGITDSMDMSRVVSGSWWWTGRPGGLQSMGLESRIWLSDWTELNILIACYVTSEIWETSCLLIAIWQKKLSKKEVWYKKNRHNNTQGQDSNGIGTIS